ncbi:MAG: cytochrome c biogenesis protein CcsA [Firmicutes bacterium]|nr:cytochrome c biogenesis protein CcsA [Bacillota bacterium]
MVAVAMLVTGAVGVLEYELVTSNFSVVDVAENTSRNLSLFLKLTALWSGSAGSLLFWVWVLSLYAAYVVGRSAHDEAPIVPYAGLILSGVSVFYLAMVTAVVPPFTTTTSPPYDGNGLDPLLQNVWMAVHPPAMYMGFIGLTVPFAWGMGALWARRGGDLWVRLSRRWLLVAWTFLTAALVLGGYWAYTELGWGGYWAWDPVENAAFMPWIVATALIHSGMVQERRGTFRVWNMLLLTAAFGLAVFGTFLTRSGFLPSIHTFSQSPVSLPLSLFFAGTLAFSVITIVWNRDLLQDASRWESYLSKEFAFLLNNVLLMGAAFSVLWGTLYPIISRDFLGQEMTVTESFFTNAVGPFAVLLLVAMGAATAVGWRRTSWRHAVRLLVWPVSVGCAAALATGLLEPPLVHHLDWRAVAGFGAAAFAITAHVGEFGRAIRARLVAGHSLTAAANDLFTRHPHRYLGYVVHIAFALMFIGIAGSWLFQQRTTLSVTNGQNVTIGGVPMTFQGLSQRMLGVNVVETAILRNRATGGVLTPEFIIYPGDPAPLARVAIMHGISGDLYVVLAGVKSGTAVLEFFVNPLVTWFWGGALLMIGCMVLLLVTNPREKTEAEREARGLGNTVHGAYLVKDRGFDGNSQGWAR